MFCPGCGVEDSSETQFCRSCGMDLGVLRNTITPSAGDGISKISTRDQVGMALAKKIESIQNAGELEKVTRKVLPEIEKFLESPEEQRLRRIRSGSVVSFVGLGAAIGFFIAALFGDPDVIVLSAFGIVTLFVGIALVVNGLLFTATKKQIAGSFSEANSNESDNTGRGTNELLMPASARQEFSSVTENTTRTLDDKLPVPKFSRED